MDVYTELLRWATDQGIQIHGIEPRRLPGRGIGIVATQQIEPDTLLLQIPITALRTHDTIPSPILQAHPKDAPVHGLLATTLALDTTPTYAAWNAVVPSRAEVESTLPLCWPKSLHRFLPKPAQDLLTKQAAKFERDWSLFSTSPLFPSLSSSLSKETYKYNWLLVNTRTFYHDPTFSSSPPKKKKVPRDDRMVLQPVADLFNHADAGCAVSFDEDSFTITADRRYTPGEEVRICYGRHTNDFLLVEYGFILASNTVSDKNDTEVNKWDEVSLDEALLPELSTAQKERLAETNFLGGYVLDAETVCYRSQVALRMLVVSLARWRAFVDGEDEAVDDEEAQEKADRLLVRILKKYVVRIEGRLDEIDECEDGEPSQRQMLAQRWRQIQGLVEKTIARLEA
ncbi:ribosomal lysine N-methyltransferase set11 [Echria macrotheca]|uniref:Ribosomal lysine N-methyltransferase set11 n=1 Tax=Echria macrotheca TaxID=438768 RepID=A0AAJ0BJZ1_9PEZI|nr:ribosomal lysine N-methyltransferase set11 [Echria macrotheca]